MAKREEKRVLVVDDDDAVRTLLFTILRRRGFQVDTARNGSDALERTKRCHYCVVLLDLMMPMMSGYEVLERFSKTPQTERPIIIVLTAGAAPRDLRPDLVAGTVRKPFDIQLLIDTVAACLGSIPSRQQTADCPAPDSETTPRSTDRGEPN